MQFMDLITSRRSIRRYASRAVETGDLEMCIETARLAPSASNGQPWRFIVVDDPRAQGRGGGGHRVSARAATSTASPRRLRSSSFFIIERSTALNRIGALLKNREYPLIDIGIAAEHFCLQAAETRPWDLHDGLVR